jgi:hypothetical protein
MSTAKPNPDKKFGKELNTDKLSFQPDDYFMKQQVTVFKKGHVKGGGGAKFNMARAKTERKKRKEKEEIERKMYPGKPKQKNQTYRDEPTLDKKGRINDKMYRFYPGLYNAVQSRITEGSYQA